MFALSTIDTQVFNVAIYVRLSREDEGSYESESILNQKEYLLRHVTEQGWNLVDVYSDDGYTGTNFDRPAFKQMLKAIETHKVNLVITKDLSRLGRDYIETGHYLERYFPQNNVRYIALNDGIDTFEVNSNNDMSPFKSVINDFYARDISKKVRTAMNTKKKNGQFIGSFAPYGYLKDPKDKSRLVVDPQTAPVVKQIFELYLSALGYAKIAEELNKQGVLCPGLYKAQTSTYKSRLKIDLWTLDTIKRILTNPTYAGHLTQNRNTIVSYKVKRNKTLPPSLWITVPHTHQPIIDQHLFDTVQHLIASKSTNYYSKPRGGHMLTGLLYCKECGSRLTFTRTHNDTVYTICSKHKRTKFCTRHAMKEDELEDMVFAALRREAGLSIVPEDLLAEAQRVSRVRKGDRQEDLTTLIESAEKRLQEIKKTLKALYEDKLKGVISERDFIEFSQDYSEEREGLSKRLLSLRQQAGQKEVLQDIDKLRCLIERAKRFRDIPKALIVTFIKKVELSEEKHVDVYYTFKPRL